MIDGTTIPTLPDDTAAVHPIWCEQNRLFDPRPLEDSGWHRGQLLSLDADRFTYTVQVQAANCFDLDEEEPSRVTLRCRENDREDCEATVYLSEAEARQVIAMLQAALRSLELEQRRSSGVTA